MRKRLPISTISTGNSFAFVSSKDQTGTVPASPIPRKCT
jgi:hypothetical protein